MRFYLPLLNIDHKRVIYLDDDVIVQGTRPTAVGVVVNFEVHLLESKSFPRLLGDIKDLFDIKLKPGHAAAFATDCDLPSTHEMVRSIGMQVALFHRTAFDCCSVQRHVQNSNISHLDLTP